MNSKERVMEEWRQDIAMIPEYQEPPVGVQRLVSRPALDELEATWSELWKHLGEPQYSPSAIELAKHCFMVGVDWGIKRAANEKGQR